MAFGGPASKRSEHFQNTLQFLYSEAPIPSHTVFPSWKNCISSKVLSPLGLH